MTTDTSQKIVEYIKNRGQVSPKELEDFLGISRQGLFKQIKRLVLKGQIQKIGRPPKVFYFLSENIATERKENSLDPKFTKIINDNFLLITPDGRRLNGISAFSYFCQKRDLEIQKTAEEYLQIIKKYDSFKKNGLINGMKKIKMTFEKVYLDKLYYLDFYSIERFGKTKLGQLLLYAKQSQNKQMIKELTEIIRPKIEQIIKRDHIDAIGFIPPTVRREVQFMKELQKYLSFPLKNIPLIKIQTPISVPQKTLSKLEDRIENAKNTIILQGESQYNNILLIDDAVGSGSTLNETAKKIKMRKTSKGKIIGLAVTGSFKGFDVISEV